MKITIKEGFIYAGEREGSVVDVSDEEAQHAIDKGAAALYEEPAKGSKKPDSPPSEASSANSNSNGNSNANSNSNGNAAKS